MFKDESAEYAANIGASILNNSKHVDNIFDYAYNDYKILNMLNCSIVSYFENLFHIKLQSVQNKRDAICRQMDYICALISQLKSALDEGEDLSCEWMVNSEKLTIKLVSLLRRNVIYLTEMITGCNSQKMISCRLETPHYYEHYVYALGSFNKDYNQYKSGIGNCKLELFKLLEEADKNDDCKSVTYFLNSKDSFQPFGARLAAFIANKLDLASTNSETVRKAIKKKCSENGMELSEIASYNTLRSWFESDQRPKKGNGSRQSMFALAFAINLSVDETKELFHKIYLDRAVNYRDEKEAIFFFCLINNKTWADAKRLIAEADNLEKDYSDITQQTNAIAESINAFQTEQDLLESGADLKEWK